MQEDTRSFQRLEFSARFVRKCSGNKKHKALKLHILPAIPHAQISDVNNESVSCPRWLFHPNQCKIRDDNCLIFKRGLSLWFECDFFSGCVDKTWMKENNETNQLLTSWKRRIWIHSAKWEEICFVKNLQRIPGVPFSIQHNEENIPWHIDRPFHRQYNRCHLLYLLPAWKR